MKAVIYKLLLITSPIILGLLLLFIFWTIEITGSFGHEPNKYIRWFEIVMGIPFLAIGLINAKREFAKIHRGE